jgi:hypothetical protein
MNLEDLDLVNDYRTTLHFLICSAFVNWSAGAGSMSSNATGLSKR